MNFESKIWYNGTKVTCRTVWVEQFHLFGIATEMKKSR